MLCPFVADKSDKTKKVCPRCGLTLQSEHPPEKCRAICKKPGLGDYAANVASALGFKKTQKCGCDKRQEAINKIGAKLGL